MIVQLSHIGGAVTPDVLGGFSYVTNDICTPRHRALPSKPAAHVRVGLHSSSARLRVRDHRGREVNHLTNFFTTLATLRKREEGQTMAEYGVVLAVITIGVVGALGLLSGAISDALNRVIGFL